MIIFVQSVVRANFVFEARNSRTLLWISLGRSSLSSNWNNGRKYLSSETSSLSVLLILTCHVLFEMVASHFKFPFGSSSGLQHNPHNSLRLDCKQNNVTTQYCYKCRLRSTNNKHYSQHRLSILNTRLYFFYPYWRAHILRFNCEIC